MRKIFFTVLALAATTVWSVAGACGTADCNPAPTPTCGSNGCYLTQGNMWVTGANLSQAWGDQAATMSGIQYNLTANLGKNELGTWDFVSLTGGFLSGSDGSGQVNSGGSVNGWATWYTKWTW